MLDYAKAQNLSASITDALMEKLEYLLFIRGEMERDLVEVNGMVEDIVKQLKECGIDID